MSRTETDYSNTLIYKIYCKDPVINDVYVGHTTNFVQRKFSHKQGALHSSNKLYDTIRNNGGWANWKMDIVAFFDCQDLREARQKEQEYFLSCKATLNSIEPFPTPKDVVIKKLQVKKEKKVIVDENEDENVNVTKKKFVCEKCEFNCTRKPDWTRHLSTAKHTKIINHSLLIHITPKHICNICSKEYKSNVGLWKHKKICKVEPIIEPIQNDKEIIEILVKEISEFKNIILDMVESNSDFKQKMLDMCKNNNV